MKAIAIQATGVRPAVQALWLGFLALFALASMANLATARSAPDSFADLAERLSPAVVNITTSTTVTQPRGGFNMPQVPEGSPFEDLFRDFFNQDGGNQGRPRRSQALGSGFIISADGFIVTNNHVIDKADEIEVEFLDGKTLKATVVGIDKKTDVALLKVEASEPLPFVQFGDSDQARVGDWVLAIGNPLGQGFSVSAGIVSARNRALQGNYDDFIQTDAAINRGNSGGPLFNMDGDVIGVNTAIISPNGGSIGLGFSMSSNVVNRVVEQIKEYGEARRGWLGVQIQNVDPQVAEALGLENDKGALVSDVPEGPAQEAGILSGDVILSFDGEDIDDVRELIRIVGDTEVGKAVRVVVFRDGATKTLKVTLGLRQDDQENPILPASVEPTAPQEKEALGMKFSSLTEEARKALKLDADAEGVVVTEVDETSEAFEKGMRQGDVVAEVSQTAVNTPEDLEQGLKAARDAGQKSVLLLVRRDGTPRFVALSVEE